MRQPSGTTPVPMTTGHHHTRPSPHAHTVRWLYDVMRSEMRDSAFPGNVLPPEDALVRRYGVSRGAVRKVIDLLREEGVVERTRGAGTFIVSPRTLPHGVGPSRDVAQDVNARAPRVSIFTTHVALHAAPAYVAGRLRVVPGTPVVLLESTTYLDGFPLSVRSAFMPFCLFGVLLDGDVDLDRSPYLVMQEVLDEHPGDTDLRITASAASHAVADLLGIQPGAPTLDTAREVYSRSGVVLEHSVAHARADRLSFCTVMAAHEPMG